MIFNPREKLKISNQSKIITIYYTINQSVKEMISAKYTIRNDVPGIILHKPLINLQTTHHQISQLPNFKSKLRAYYKRFYKLRKFQYGRVSLYGTTFNPPGHEYVGDEYHTLLRRKFSNENYNLRREVFLGMKQELREDELEERLMNTLAFVFNATVDAGKSEGSGGDDVVVFEKGLVSETNETMECKIINSMIKIDLTLPNEIKYDYKYQWVEQLQQQLKIMEEKKDSLTKKQIKKFQIPIEFIGYKTFNINLLKLNENLKLCL